MNRLLSNRLRRLEQSVQKPVVEICLWAALDQLLPQLKLIARKGVGVEKVGASELIAAHASRLESLNDLSVDALTLLLEAIETYENNSGLSGAKG